MNTPEERLHDALRAAGEIIEAVPAFALPTPRLPRRLRRLAVFGTITALIIGGITFWSGSGDKEPLSSPALAGLVEPGEISVFLCVGRTSGNPACAHKDATAAEKEFLKQRLMSFPRVVMVEYQSQEDAFALFVKTFRDHPGLVAATKVGDIPDSFRVRLSGTGSAEPVTSALVGMPGVDQVVDESERRHN
ncbi:MAG: permease-like cell division protein FtsX [Streptosporangiaceae bacterium]